jgi:molecular chaperone GrpE (heat shock protein)
MMFRRLPVASVLRSVVGRPAQRGTGAALFPTLKQLGGAKHFSDSADKAAQSAAEAAAAVATESTQAAAEAAEPAAEVIVEDRDPAEALRHQNQTLQDEIRTIKDKLLRSYAEEENVRSIAQRDVASAKEYANMKFAKSMLDVADNLERAIDAISHEQRADADPHFVTLLQGVEMTQRGLTKVFQSHGIVRVRIYYVLFCSVLLSMFLKHHITW